MRSIRQPAVAGSFYPDNPHELRAMLAEYLEQAEPSVTAPKAIIVPHAGYIYSGVCAAKAYARLAPKHAMIKRVVLLGPSHHVAFTGLALSSADVFNTPLGDIPLDKKAIDSLLQFPSVAYLDQAHALEHSLEVQLPFLQMTLGMCMK